MALKQRRLKSHSGHIPLSAGWPFTHCSPQDPSSTKCNPCAKHLVATAPMSRQDSAGSHTSNEIHSLTESHVPSLQNSMTRRSTIPSAKYLWDQTGQLPNIWWKAPMVITGWSLLVIKLHDDIILTMVQRNLWVTTLCHRVIIITHALNNLIFGEIFLDL